MAKNNFGIICQSCGVEAPVKYVDFMQNIGMLVMRRQYEVKGNLCKRCVHKQFWKRTATTFFLGPWGTISVFVAPLFILNNIGWYASRLFMPGVPAGATKPVLTPEALKSIEPSAAQLMARLGAKESLDTIAPDIAAKAGVTPGQVVLYALALARQTRPQPAAPAAPIQRGFPVVPVANPPAAMPPAPVFEPFSQSPPAAPPVQATPPPLPPSAPPKTSDDIGIV